MENLTYSYFNLGNKLNTVTDAGSTEGYHAVGGTYLYDANGNMNYDPSKGTTIEYNYLNLPENVEFGANDNLRYTYDAAGNKLVKVVDGTMAENNTRLDYSGNFLYENNELKAIFTSVGRIVPFDNGDETIFKFEYNLQDHLGNTRVVFSGHSNGQPEVMQVTDYYPFGMLEQSGNPASAGVMNQTNTFADGVLPNKYLYNNKELQDDELTGNSLGWYDYGARFYDAELGRWHAVDPKAEKYYFNSPYSYVSNNPIIKIDPDGKDEWEVNNKGLIEWKKKSDKHQLYLIDKEGERTSSIEVGDRSILDQLSKSRKKFKYMNDSGDERKATSDESGGEDMLKTFTFLADNTSSEWKIEFARSEGKTQYGIGTYGLDDLSPGIFKRSEIITSVHSHPNPKNNMNNEEDSMYGDRMNSYDRKYGFYVYMPKSTRLWNVKQGQSSYIRHIKNDYKRFINMK